MKEAGADSVKLEGGAEIVPIIEALARAGVPVLGHVGLTPQTASALGGYKLQGKDEENARRILEGRRRSSAPAAGAGAGSWCLRRSRAWSRAHRHPTIGIGAGAHCDGQVLVFHDLVGLFSAYAELRQALRGSRRRDQGRRRRYAADVPTAAFRPKGRASA